MTYTESRRSLLDYLASKGWTVTERNAHTGELLKVPRATSPDGRIVLSFRRQAIYQGEHFLHSDMKEVDGASLVRMAERRMLD